MKIHFVLFISLFAIQPLFAQDPVLTQFYAAPVLVNPSFAGSVGDARIAVGYRDQWNGSNYKFSTTYISTDNWFEGINSGLGFSIVNQKETLTSYNFTEAKVSYAYHLKISETITFFPGISFGVGTKHFNFQNLILGDQISLFDGSLDPVSNDPFLEKDRVSFFDVSVGGVLYLENAWLGLSVKHLNKPDISFLNDEPLALPVLYSVHGGYQFRLNQGNPDGVLPYESFLFLTLNYMNQDTSNRLDLGAEINISQFYAGVLASAQTYKLVSGSDTLLSVNPLFGVRFNNFKIGFSYDFPVSDIGNIAGTSEINLQYVFRKTTKNRRARLWQVKN